MLERESGQRELYGKCRFGECKEKLMIRLKSMYEVEVAKTKVMEKMYLN